MVATRSRGAAAPPIPSAPVKRKAPARSAKSKKQVAALAPPATPPRASPLRPAPPSLSPLASPSPGAKSSRLPRVVHDKENASHNSACSAKSSAAILADFDSEVRNRVDAMRQAAADMCTGIRNSHRLQLMKLPRAIREMPVSELQKLYNGDADLAMTGELQKIIDGLLPPSGSDSNQLTTPRNGRSFMDCANMLTVSRRITRSTTRKLRSIQKLEQQKMCSRESLAEVQRTLSFGIVPLSQSAPNTARSVVAPSMPTSRSLNSYLQGAELDAEGLKKLDKSARAKKRQELQELNAQVQALLSTLRDE